MPCASCFSSVMLCVKNRETAFFIGSADHQLPYAPGQPTEPIEPAQGMEPYLFSFNTTASPIATLHSTGVVGPPAGGRCGGGRGAGGRLRYRLDNEEHAGTHGVGVRERRLGSRRSRPLGRAWRGAEADDLSSPLIRLAFFEPVPFCVPASRAGPHGGGAPPALERAGHRSRPVRAVKPPTW